MRRCWPASCTLRGAEAWLRDLFAGAQGPSEAGPELAADATAAELAGWLVDQGCSIAQAIALDRSAVWRCPEDPALLKCLLVNGLDLACLRFTDREAEGRAKGLLDDAYLEPSDAFWATAPTGTGSDGDPRPPKTCTWAARWHGIACAGEEGSRCAVRGDEAAALRQYAATIDSGAELVGAVRWLAVVTTVQRREQRGWTPPAAPGHAIDDGGPGAIDGGAIVVRMRALRALVTPDAAIDIIHGPALSLLAVNLTHLKHATTPAAFTQSCQWLLDYVARLDWSGYQLCPVTSRALAEARGLEEDYASLSALLSSNTDYENGEGTHACVNRGTASPQLDPS